MNLQRLLLERLIVGALEEDLGSRDLTTESVVPKEQRAVGIFIAKDALVLAGLEVAHTTFALSDAEMRWDASVKDGVLTRPGQEIATIVGRARPILGAERVALNFLQRMTAVATLTRSFVQAVAGTRARIRDTRKTTPMLRALEKYAVEVGGGVPHRSGLDSGVLVKDNHIRLAGSVGEATLRACAGDHKQQVEVEIEEIGQVEEALEAGASMILLDNFTPEAVRNAVRLVNGRVPVEVSGRVRLDNVRAFAEAGPDFIAVGALTHSAPAADISLEIEPE